MGIEDKANDVRPDGEEHTTTTTNEAVGRAREATLTICRLRWMRSYRCKRMGYKWIQGDFKINDIDSHRKNKKDSPVLELS